MTYLLSFLFCGVLCALSQLVLDKTKLTPGHVNTILVIIGCILSGFGIYDHLINIFSAGCSVPIMNFGHLLVTGASVGFKDYGFIGLFKGIVVNASAGISITIFMAVLMSLFFKVKH